MGAVVSFVLGVTTRSQQERKRPWLPRFHALACCSSGR